MIERTRPGRPTDEERLDALLGAVDRPTDLVGRRSDLVAVSSRLRRGRLVTITGPGGVGKTALADTVAEFVGDLFDDRWRCDLTAAHDRASLDAVIADSIGAHRSDDASAFDPIVEVLSARQALLVLDDVEQVVGAAANAVGVLLDRCPGLTVLATSRSAIGIEREDVWVLTPLNSQTEAPELFARLARERVDAAAGEWPGSREAVVDLCSDLDGVPLAIELAAARLPDLSLDQIQGQLDERFRVVRHREPVDRRATIVNVVRWSYDLLEPIDRHLFERLSVFQGGFDAAGAAAVLGPEAARLDVAAMLARLATSSMIQPDSGPGAQRFDMLEPLRQFGDRQLTERGERASVRNAHLEHVITVTAAASARCHGSEWRGGVEDLLAEWCNLRVAANWAIDSQRHSEVDRLLRDVFFFSRWRLQPEPAGWARRALDRAEVTDASIGAPAHLHAGFSSLLAGDHEAALTSNQLALSVSGTPTDRSWARLHSALELLQLGRTTEAADVADAMVADSPPHQTEQAMQGSSHAVVSSLVGRLSVGEATTIHGRMRELAEASQSPVAIGYVAYNGATLQSALGDADGAAAGFDEALAIARTHDIAALVEYVLLARVYEPGAAGLRAALHAIRSWDERGDAGNEFVVLEAIGINFAELGRTEPAAVILGHLDQTSRRRTSSLDRREAAAAEIVLARRGERWTTRGQDMTRAEVIEYARTVLGHAVALL